MRASSTLIFAIFLGCHAAMLSQASTSFGIPDRTRRNAFVPNPVPSTARQGSSSRCRVTSFKSKAVNRHAAARVGHALPCALRMSENDLEKIPISLLSGFLGSGKTTLLQEMLQNKGGLKVGIVVNDMAAVNIDSKLVKSDTKRGLTSFAGELVDSSDVMELQNGCACCSASEELLQAIMKLLIVSAEREDPFDRIVIELSGVAEPKNIRKQFYEMEYAGHPALDYAELQNMVTVVDAGNFLSMYQSAEGIQDRPDLIEDDTNMVFTDRKIVDLLTEQVEVADYVLLNKADLVNDGQMERLKKIVSFLNPTADIIPSTFGKVDLAVVLGSERSTWVAKADDEDDFRSVVKSALRNEEEKQPEHKIVGKKHAHGSSQTECHDPNCNDPSHSHELASHSHSHDAACSDPTCTDPSHSHEHAHSHDHDSDCKDPECTDATHSHSHSHSHSHKDDPETKFGITSFVYTRRRPFHPDRLKSVIKKLPIKSSSSNGQEGWAIPGVDASSETSENPMRNILRSKGFVWLSTYHRVALFWSHAGQFFDLKDFGMYWAATPLKFWPKSQEELREIIDDFGSKDLEWGDRRQEIVFIGVGMAKEKIESLLDDCLLTDEEMELYRESASEFPDLVAVDWSADPPRPRSRK